MAKLYLEKLTHLVEEMKLKDQNHHSIELKHFFNGAALYANGVISVSLSPVGLAFKLPEPLISELLTNGSAVPLKYFPKGHIKKGYALFPEPEFSETEKWKKYFLISMQL